MPVDKVVKRVIDGSEARVYSQQRAVLPVTTIFSRQDLVVVRGLVTWDELMARRSLANEGVYFELS